MVAFACLHYLVLKWVVLPGFTALEHEDVVKNIERCTGVLDREVRHLDALCYDYAAWDDTYEFIQDLNHEYIDSNLPSITYTGDELDVICFYDARGEAVYGRVYNLAGEERLDATEFLPSVLPAEHLLRVREAGGVALSDLKVAGIFPTSRGPLVVSSRPIITSDKEGPIRGNVVLGWLLDNERVESLAERIQVPFQLWMPDDETIPAEAGAAFTKVTADNPVWIEANDSSLLHIHTDYPSVSGDTALLMKIDVPRPITTTGAKVMRFAWIAILLFSAVTLVVLLISIQRVVLRPVTTMIDTVAELATTCDLSKRLPPGRNDELGKLSAGVNQMLGVLEVSTTERLKFEALEKTLREEKERISALLSSTGDLVAAMDDDYTILFMSGELVKQFGEQTGKKCYRAFCGLDEPCGVNCAVDEVIKKGKDSFEYSHEEVQDVHASRVRKDAVPLALERERVLETVAHPFFYEGKRCVMEVSRDVTERKQLADQLRQAQKMEAVGTLAGGIAHDFNNILQGIMGYSEIAKLSLSPDDSAYQDVEQIMKGTERAATLIRQLLAFSRRQMILPVDLDLNVIITGRMEMLSRVMGEHIELNLNTSTEASCVHADPGMLEQVLMNLCVNARDAMPSGGQITIETENVALGDTFCQTHPWAAPGDYALLSVTDTGTGMPPDVVTRVFEPFFTTKETGEGTGLGLSMIYGIVKQHKGLVHCYSEPGQGSCFKIYLPSVERVAETNEEATVTPPPVGRAETILLAEDDEMVRDLAVLTLKMNGYRVLVAKDGEEALRLFEEREEDIQFALLDVVMPNVGGREVYDTIRAVKPDLPVLFSSGYSTNSIHVGFVVEEGLEIFQKPYSPSALLRKVREVLDAPR